MTVHIGNAVWNGNLKEGKGRVSTQSGALDQPYGFSARFEDGKGTNPEELIGAAHAACFSMAFAHALDTAGFPADEIKTEDRVTLEKQGDAFVITSIQVNVEAKVAKMDDAAFQAKALEVSKTCPVSKALAGTKITVLAVLKNETSSDKRAG